MLVCGSCLAGRAKTEVWGDLVALLVFKTSVGLKQVPGGFDSHPPPPISPPGPVDAMLKRIPQPPVKPEQRARELHDFWPGFAVALAGLILLVCGVRHVTAVSSTEGGTADETQLVQAFSAGAVQYADRLPPPPPPDLKNAANPAEALDRWNKARKAKPDWKVRVDVTAKTPCPT